jgi:hypothetical protein
MSEIEKALQEASAPSFWGSVEIAYKRGEPSYVKIIRTTQLENLKKEYPYDRNRQTR